MAKKEKSERRFIKEQVKEMPIREIEKDLLVSKWGKETFMTENEIKKILNRKESIK